MDLCKSHENIITIEEGTLAGGFGSAVSDFLHDNNQTNTLSRLGISDHFIQHGTRNELLQEVGLTAEHLISVLNKHVIKQDIYEF